MIASLFARRGNQRGLGIALSTLGLTISGASAWIGGHLVYVLGTNINRAVFEPAVEEFTPVIGADALAPGKLVGAELEVDGQKVPLVLLRQGESILALSGTCTHWGGPLAEGKLVDDSCVECPWHGSQFSMADGSVKQGPASIPERAYEARISNGMVEVRQRRS